LYAVAATIFTCCIGAASSYGQILSPCAPRHITDVLQELLGYNIAKPQPVAASGDRKNGEVATLSGNAESTRTSNIIVTYSDISADGSDADKTDATLLLEDESDPVINKYAEMISVSPVDINNFPLFRFIDEWYGIPYKYGGADSAGIDCSAFSQKLYGRIYAVDIRRTSRQQHRQSEHIRKVDDAAEGDLVFFRIRSFRISHVGVYLANGYFVHASRSHGVTISSINDKYWHRRFAGCGHVTRDDKTITESDLIPQ
jgi:hypothetical protein